MLPFCPSPTYTELFSYVQRINLLNGGSSSALFVIKQDRVVAEYYAGRHSAEATARDTAADSQYNVASVRKSYLGLAAALAQYQGAIPSFEEQVLRYLPSEGNERLSLEGVTIRHLLTHTHGLTRNEEGKLERQFQPGTSWHYNNEGIRLLSTIISKTTEASIAGLLDQMVFRPLGWQETGWRTSPSSQLVPVCNNLCSELLLSESAYGDDSNLFVSARELAYWGYLHLKHGRINGQQIVPEAVLRSVLHIQSPAGLPAVYPTHGCLWQIQTADSAISFMGPNVPKGAFGLVGLYGPLLFIVPDLELVVVRMTNCARNYENAEGTYIDYLHAFTDLAIRTTHASLF